MKIEFLTESPEWSVEYNAKNLTARFDGRIWYEIWRVFPGLKCVATAAQYTFFTNEDGTQHYFTVQRGDYE